MRCGDWTVADAELVMLVAHGSALAALGDEVGCAGNVCRVSWCPIALLAPRFEVEVIDENRKAQHRESWSMVGWNILTRVISSY